MRDIATVMEHPEFNAFFEKYFNDSTDVRAILMLMKIYQAIPSKDPYEKIAILYEAMNTSKVRTMIMDSFNNWSSGNSNKIEDKPSQLGDLPDSINYRGNNKYSTNSKQLIKHFIR
jgi:hypothetical protein